MATLFRNRNNGRRRTYGDRRARIVELIAHTAPTASGWECSSGFRSQAVGVGAKPVRAVGRFDAEDLAHDRRRLIAGYHEGQVAALAPIDGYVGIGRQPPVGEPSRIRDRIPHLAYRVGESPLESGSLSLNRVERSDTGRDRFWSLAPDSLPCSFDGCGGGGRTE